MIQHRARPDTSAGGSKQQKFEVGPAGKIFSICLKKSLAPHLVEVYPILFLNPTQQFSNLADFSMC